MRRTTQAALLGLSAFVCLAASAADQGWMGAAAEKAYDKDLDAKRLAEALNNDDYYELMHEGRVMVFSDAKDYKVWLKTGEMPLGVTRFRAGPNGETVKMSLTKTETKAMEKVVGYKGGAQNLYEGNIEGLAKGFFGFLKQGDTYYVSDSWKALAALKKGGASDGATAQWDGKSIVYLGAASVPAELAARFAALHDGQ